MICLKHEEMIALALGREAAGAAAHLAECPKCREEADHRRKLVARLTEAHQALDQGHDAGRERLMAALIAEPTFTSRHSLWKGRLSMKQRIACSGIGLAAVLLLAVWLTLAGRTSLAWAQVAAKIRDAKSFTCETVMHIDGSKSLLGGRFYWQAPGTVRLEEAALPAGNTLVSIIPYHRPGLQIDDEHKTYVRLPAREGYTAPLMAAVWKLGDFAGEGDKQPQTGRINGKPARFFRIPINKVDPNLDGTLTVWVDPESNLPAEIMCHTLRPKGTMSLAHFHWNTELDAKLFDTTPPEGYADKTPKPPALDETVDRIVEALTFYSEVMGGHYPRVKMVYGDVTIHELFDKLGVNMGKPTQEQIKSEAYVKGLKATRGFAAINGILRDNADAAYYGKSVSPADKGKVLLRWQLDDGKYHVIFGDLHDENVSAARLRALESQ